eukprot:3250356-Rhodomonas_salina.1
MRAKPQTATAVPTRLGHSPTVATPLHAAPGYRDYDPIRRHSHHGHVTTDGSHWFLNQCAWVTDSKSRD